MRLFEAIGDAVEDILNQMAKPRNGKPPKDAKDPKGAKAQESLVTPKASRIRKVGNVG
jgi:hypothetical protein